MLSSNLLDGLFADLAVTVDEINGFIYWSESGRGIIKAALDGSNEQEISNPGESKLMCTVWATINRAYN